VQVEDGAGSEQEDLDQGTLSEGTKDSDHSNWDDVPLKGEDGDHSSFSLEEAPVTKKRSSDDENSDHKPRQWSSGSSFGYLD
jgi:hypothetical protein